MLVTNITPLDATASEQRLQVDIRTLNSNDFNLIVTGIDFILNVNGERSARSLANEELAIPRLSDAVISGQTSTSTVDLTRQFLSLSQK